MTTASAAYRAARDQLVRHREDYAAVVSALNWPEVGDRFNWATDWFDVIAQGNSQTALRIIGDDGADDCFRSPRWRSARIASRPGSRTAAWRPVSPSLPHLLRGLRLVCFLSFAGGVGKTTLAVRDRLAGRLDRTIRDRRRFRGLGPGPAARRREVRTRGRDPPGRTARVARERLGTRRLARGRRRPPVRCRNSLRRRCPGTPAASPHVGFRPGFREPRQRVRAPRCSDAARCRPCGRRRPGGRRSRLRRSTKVIAI